MIRATVLIIALAFAMGGCATTSPKDPSIIVQEKYIVPIPPSELIEPPAAERQAQLRTLDPDIATDKDLAALLLDKQAYINALEKNSFKLKEWYSKRLELLKENIKPEDIRVIE